MIRMRLADGEKFIPGFCERLARIVVLVEKIDRFIESSGERRILLSRNAAYDDQADGAVAQSFYDGRSVHSLVWSFLFFCSINSPSFSSIVFLLSGQRKELLANPSRLSILPHRYASFLCRTAIISTISFLSRT
ncbi:MAG: hypothetical protein HY033_02660 [Ignavibacteriae bacterium]|nr:hypothetical protein [Ignavibacteria bacterium]MBI3363789.1 hypothetical protein [Ignavibacteriota bacterium]